MRQNLSARMLIPVPWMALIFALSSRSHYDAPGGLSASVLAVVAHLFLYGVLGGLILIALGNSWSGSPTKRIIVAALLAMAYGVTDEIHQAFVPLRDASIFDIAIDGIGALTATIVFQFMLDWRARKRVS